MQKFHLLITFIKTISHLIFIGFVYSNSIWLQYENELLSRGVTWLLYDPTMLRLAFTWLTPFSFHYALGRPNFNAFLFAGLDVFLFFTTRPFGCSNILLFFRVSETFVLGFIGRYGSYAGFVEGSISGMAKLLRKTRSATERLIEQKSKREKNQQLHKDILNLAQKIEGLNKRSLSKNKTYIVDTLREVVRKADNFEAFTSEEQVNLQTGTTE